jgi:hypothetical protein
MSAIIVFMLLSIFLFSAKEVVKIELKLLAQCGFDFGHSGKIFPKEAHDF